MKKWIVPSFILLMALSAIGLLAYIATDRSPIATSAELRSPGVTDSEIVIGTVAALSGPTMFLGTEYLRGAQAYISAINDAGGVYGRKIKLVAYDDQYDPPKTVYYTQKAILEDKAFALLNFVGTPTGKRIVPLINEAKIPLVGIYSGGQIFRNPLQPYIFNIRASYHQEAAALVKDLVERQKLTRIAVLYQYDDFGFDGLTGTEIALTAYGLRPVATAPYPRNTDDVEEAADAIRAAAPEAVILVAVHNPATKFISLAKTPTFNPVFATMSPFVGTEASAKNPDASGEGVIVSQTIPLLRENAALDCPDDYTTLMRRYFPNETPTLNGFEGFINAKILVEGLRQAGQTPTRSSLLSALESIADHPVTQGLKATFSRTDHQALDHVYLTRIKNGIYEPIGEAPPRGICLRTQ